MKKILLLLLLFANLQMIIKDQGLSLCPLSTALAQQMTEEGLYQCYDEEADEYYYSSFSECTVTCDTTVYTCAFCEKTFSTPEECTQHEEVCPQKPGNGSNVGGGFNDIGSGSDAGGTASSSGGGSSTGIASYSSKSSVTTNLDNSKITNCVPFSLSFLYKLQTAGVKTTIYYKECLLRVWYIDHWEKVPAYYNKSNKNLNIGKFNRMILTHELFHAIDDVIIMDLSDVNRLKNEYVAYIMTDFVLYTSDSGGACQALTIKISPFLFGFFDACCNYNDKTVKIDTWNHYVTDEKFVQSFLNKHPQYEGSINKFDWSTYFEAIGYKIINE